MAELITIQDLQRLANCDWCEVVFLGLTAAREHEKSCSRNPFNEENQ